MAAADRTGLQDVQVCGQWNFTLQADTPIHWLRSGCLEFYLLRFRVHSMRPSTWGVVLHGEADGEGTDGVTFYVERRLAYGKAAAAAGQGFKRYVLTGEGLDSRPVVSNQYPDGGGELVEDFEVLLQGHSGVVFIQNRKIQLNFKTRRGKGSVGFFNTTRADDDNIHFAKVWLTAVRRGPMECAGTLGRRVQHFETPPKPKPVLLAGEAAEGEEIQRDHAGEAAAATQIEAVEDALRDRGESLPVMKERPPLNISSGQGGRLAADDQTVTARTGWRAAASRSRQAQASQTFSGAEGMRSPANSTGRRGGNLQLSPQLRASASEGVLRKTPAAPPGAAFTRSGSLSGKQTQSGTWRACASSVPAGEQQFMKDVFWRELSKQKPGACQDFIPM